MVRCAYSHDHTLMCRFPGRKEENWWLVVGDPKKNTLLAIKRQALQKKGRAKLDITAPSEPGTHHLTLFFMCDSYMGCDQVRLLFRSSCDLSHALLCLSLAKGGHAASGMAYQFRLDVPTLWEHLPPSNIFACTFLCLIMACGTPGQALLLATLSLSAALSCRCLWIG